MFNTMTRVPRLYIISERILHMCETKLLLILLLLNYNLLVIIITLDKVMVSKLILRIISSQYD